MPSSPFQLLRSRNYGIVWWSGFVSDAGTWMQTVAIGALITELTHSAAWGSIAAAINYLLIGIGTPFAGVFADHHDRRKMLLFAAGANGFIALALAATYASDVISPALVVAFVALEGAFVAIAWPTRSAFLSQLVRREDLSTAISLGPASWNLGRAIGPALAALLITQASYTAVFVLNAITFVISAIALRLVKPLPQVYEETSDGVMARLRAGLRVTSADPGTKFVLVFMSVFALTVSPFIALIPAMAQLTLDGSASDTARFVTAQGVGAVFGSFSFAWLLRRLSHANALMLAASISLLAHLAFALAANMTTAMIALFVLGFFYVIVLTTLNAVLQLRVAPEFRARAVGLFLMSLSVFYPIGSAIQSALADWLGVREVLAGGSIVMGALLVGVLTARRGVLAYLTIEQQTAETAQGK